MRIKPSLNIFICYVFMITVFYSCSNNDNSNILKTENISDNELLDIVQKQTFNYFWEFAHVSSGMALERSDLNAYGGEAPNIVTTGGSGFGVMAIVVGVERNYITRDQAIKRLNKLTDFLLKSERFHGAFAHWYYGHTGKVRPFFTEDNGGDIVETSFLIQGLLTARQYFDRDELQENSLRDKINKIWNEVEWDWYTNGGNLLIWHWSPNYEWAINHQIKGYNEALITYLLASSSPLHSIDESVYHEGWASGNNFLNENIYFEKWKLPLGPSFGGPLFFSHYSFLGLDPNGLTDAYADYWEQNVNHTLINREYCIKNPKKFIGYGENCWGLTASDNHIGYSAHSPTNDLGVISPTAALSSFPFTPEYSMKALRHFYYDFDGKLWGEYGFYDAFNLTENWYANNYLAIDQGPIIIMIENYRTGLLWNLFMSCPEIKNGLLKLNFTSPHLN